jgi:hypothetical protein
MWANQLHDVVYVKTEATNDLLGTLFCSLFVFATASSAFARNFVPAHESFMGFRLVLSEGLEFIGGGQSGFFLELSESLFEGSD